MRGLNHLVLTGHDLDRMRDHYEALGFTLAPRGRHPFGTDNAVIQLLGCYLELLAVARPQDVPEHGANSFSFAAFNRDYVARHEGFAMLVFDTPDARADIAAWQKAGLKTYEPFDFQRAAKLPSGEEITVGFSLAFTRAAIAPWIGLFACQHYRPDYYEQERYLAHANTAQGVREVWISGDGALALCDFMAKLTGLEAQPESADKVFFTTRTGDLVLAAPQAFAAAFGEAPPHPQDGPHLAGLTIGCRDLSPLAGRNLQKIGDRLVLPAKRNFGTALAFSQG
ncbi:MAG: VOC family protein [Rhizobiales bacterium]|nr:VOC family protein [Hyphomicrobiales bacterium]